MTPGTIGVCALETGRYSAFSESLAAIQAPPGTVINWAYGETIAGRNTLIAQMRGDWIWFMDDDHAFEPDLLMKLLKHDVDVVVPVVLMRQRPFFPVARMSEDTVINWKPAGGLVEIHSAGTAGMLIKRSVVVSYMSAYGSSLFMRGPVSEDYLFCERLREIGIPIHCDLGSRLGHLTSTSIWPGHTDEGEACVSFVVSDSYLVKVGIERD